MDCSPPGFSVHRILQARILEWVPIISSRGSPWPRDWILVSYIAGRFFTVWATREAHFLLYIPCHNKNMKKLILIAMMWLEYTQACGIFKLKLGKSRETKDELITVPLTLNYYVRNSAQSPKQKFSALQELSSFYYSLLSLTNIWIGRLAVSPSNTLDQPGLDLGSRSQEEIRDEPRGWCHMPNAPDFPVRSWEGPEARTPLRRQPCGWRHNTKGHCHPRASSAKTRGFHTQLDEGPETPWATREASGVPFLRQDEAHFFHCQQCKNS